MLMLAICGPNVNAPPAPSEGGEPTPGAALGSTRDRVPMRHFRQVPQFLPSLEFFLLLGVLVFIDTTLSTMLLPLKFVLAPRRVAKRDVLALLLVVAGLCGFLVPTESMLYSYFYHFIRASSMLKLYVIFNMLEVAEKLLSSLVSDACEALSSAMRSKSSAGLCFSLMMLAVAAAGVALHSLTLLLHVITINVAINSQGNSLAALLVSNNFLEVKSAVFKRYTVESLCQVAMGDAVERFQYVVFILVMLGQHAQSEGFGTVEPVEVMLIFGCEVFIDFVKHLFIARFNRIHLASYDYFAHLLMLDVARERYLGSIKVPLLTTPRAAAQLARNGVLSGAFPHPYRHVMGDGQTVACSLCVIGHTNEIAASEGHNFVPQPARRAAFVPFAYVALLMWQFSPSLWRFVQHDHASLLLFFLSLVAAKAVTSTLLGGVSLRFACRSMLRDENRLLRPAAATAQQQGTAARSVSPTTSPANASLPVAPLFAAPPPMTLPAPSSALQSPLLSAAARRDGQAGVWFRRSTLDPQQTPSDLFGVSPVGMGVSVPVATPQLLSLQLAPGAARNGTASVHTRQLSHTSSAADIEANLHLEPTANCGDEMTPGGGHLAARREPPRLVRRKDRGVDGLSASTGSEGGDAGDALKLCILLDEVQAALFGVDRFDNRAGKSSK